MKALRNIIIVAGVVFSCCNNLSAQCWFLNKDFDTIEVEHLDDKIISRDFGYGFVYKFLVDNYDKDKDSVIYLSLYYLPGWCDSNNIMKLDHNLNVLDVRHCGDVYTRWKINDKFYSLKNFIDPTDKTLRVYQLYYSDTNGNTSTFDICKIEESLINSPEKNTELVQSFVDFDTNFVLCLGYYEGSQLEGSPQLYFDVYRVDTLGNVLNQNHLVIDVSIWYDDPKKNVSYFNQIIPAEDYLILNLHNENYEGMNQVLFHIERESLSIIDTLIFSERDKRCMSGGEVLMLDGQKAIINDLGERYCSKLMFYDCKADELLCRLDIPFDASKGPSTDAYFGLGNGGALTNAVEKTFMSFTNKDSIYYAAGVPIQKEKHGIATEYCFGLQVSNFTQEGKLNYSKFYTNITDVPVDVTALPDGSLAMLCVANADGDFHTKIMKYMPNGFVSLQTLDKEDIFTLVYPNPAKEVINITSSEQIEAVEIINLAGQTVYSSKENSKNVTIATQTFEKGSYLVQIHTAKGLSTQKIVVE